MKKKTKIERIFPDPKIHQQFSECSFYQNFDHKKFEFQNEREAKKLSIEHNDYFVNDVHYIRNPVYLSLLRLNLLPKVLTKLVFEYFGEYGLLFIIEKLLKILTETQSVQTGFIALNRIIESTDGHMHPYSLFYSLVQALEKIQNNEQTFNPEYPFRLLDNTRLEGELYALNFVIFFCDKLLFKVENFIFPLTLNQYLSTLLIPDFKEPPSDHELSSFRARDSMIKDLHDNLNSFLSCFNRKPIPYYRNKFKENSLKFGKKNLLEIINTKSSWFPYWKSQSTKILLKIVGNACLYDHEGIASLKREIFLLGNKISKEQRDELLNELERLRLTIPKPVVLIEGPKQFLVSC